MESATHIPNEPLRLRWIQQGSHEMGSEMSDGKEEPELRTKHKRTRKGCWVCRFRRKKCDEQRPLCQTCVRLGIKCAGYETRPTNDELFRAIQKSNKRQKNDSSTQLVEQPLEKFSPYISSDLQLTSRQQVQIHVFLESTRPLLIPMWRPDSLVKTRHDFVLQYIHEKSCEKITTAFGSMCMHPENEVERMAPVTQSYLYMKRFWDITSDALLYTILIHCGMESCLNSGLWVPHVRAAVQIIKTRGLASPESKPGYIFLCRMFTWLDICLCTTTRQRSEMPFRDYNKLSWLQHDFIVGCTTQTLVLLQSATEAEIEVDETKGSEEALLQVLAIYAQLQSISDYGIAPLAGKLYVVAVKCYVLCIINGCCPKLQIFQDIVAQGIELATEFRNTSTASDRGISFCLLMLGASAHLPEHRHFFRGRFERQSRFAAIQFDAVLQYLENLWSIRDKLGDGVQVHWRTALLTFSHNYYNDPEKLIFW